MKVVQPASHEFSVNLIFDDYGLGPYFGADRRVKEVNGSTTARFQYNGEKWLAKLYYQDSGFVSPESGILPTGTEFEIDNLREFRIEIRAVDDPVGERSANAHISPRWQGMRYETGEGTAEFSVPDEIEEGINVSMSGSNIQFSEYPNLLVAGAEAVGVRGYYFEDPHEMSNVQDAARYVRLHKDKSGPLHARRGPIASMGHLLEHDREGYRRIEQADDDERGRNLPGYRHTVTLGSGRISDAFPGHQIPKEIKHYYAREAHNAPEDHPLSHPKFEIAYQVNRWDQIVHLDDLDELIKELDETLHSSLADANIQVHAGKSDPFFEDPYFLPENREVSNDYLFELDTAGIEHDQETVVLKYLQDGGFSPVEWDCLNHLVTDGGDTAPDDIAESADWHPDSVRKALRRMDELIHREYGSVALKSPFVAELIHKKIETAKEAAKDAAGAMAKVAEAGERQLDETTSAFIAWAASLGLDVDNKTEAQMILRFGSIESSRLKWQLRRGFDLWTDAGKDPARFRMAQIRYNGRRSDAWRYL